MEKKLYLLICRNPEVDIYPFTSLRKCKKFCIEEFGFEEDDWEILLEGDMVIDSEAYYWELRTEHLYT